jgi:hypothetical protein
VEKVADRHGAMAAEEVFFPDLFEESAVRLAPAPKTLANEHGWKANQLGRFSLN